MNIVFMGTPDIAKESLEAIYNSGHNILAVVTNPDRPKGRGMKMIATPVKEFAIEKGIQILQPEKVKGNEELIKKINDLKPDLICVVAYGKILPLELIKIPRFGSINLHGSLLPKYRGAAPIQWAVLNGDTETGATIMYIDEQLDSGDMILKEKIQIGQYETTGEVWEKVSKIGSKLLINAISLIEKGEAPREKQGNNYTLAPMLNKEMSLIDWNKTSEEINNLVRGLNPIMGAYTMLDGKKIKIWKVKIVQPVGNKKPGTILEASDKFGLVVATGNGAISVEEIQGENSRKMTIEEFLRGNKIEKGKILKK